MKVKVELFDVDIDAIHAQMPLFKKTFPNFELISRSLVPDTELTEWNGEHGDMYEVEFEFQSMNHFWFMAKLTGIYQRERGII